MDRKARRHAPIFADTQRFAASQGAPLLLGNILSGPLGDWLIARDRRWMAWAPMATALVITPALTAAFLVHNLPLSLLLLAAPSLMQGLSVGPTYTLLESLAPVRARATATALLGFCVTIAGAGLGPLVLGLRSQILSVRAGYEGCGCLFSSSVRSMRWLALFISECRQCWSQTLPMLKSQCR